MHTVVLDGRGGSGHASKSIGGGSGGYPGAGIGGGGAGGAGATDCAGAGGYTGGTSRVCAEYSQNGLAGKYNVTSNYYSLSGGGYFQGGIGLDESSVNREKLCFGGFHSHGWYQDGSHQSGDGGTAGKGGIVKVSSTSKIYAFNGNLFTDGTAYNDGINQCPIYLQCGVVPAKYTYKELERETRKLKFNLILLTNEKSVASLNYVNEKYSETAFASNKTLNINTKLGLTAGTNSILTAVDMSKQGIGSGAGYIEVSNGTYTVDSSLN